MLNVFDVIPKMKKRIKYAKWKTACMLGMCATTAATKLKQAQGRSLIGVNPILL